MVKLFSPKLLTVGCWNIQGVYETVNNVKINKLEDEIFLNMLKKFDILCLQETHLGPDEIPSIDENYVPVPHCRNISGNNRYFGGMLLLVRKSIRSLVEIRKDFDQDLIEVILNKKPFNFDADKSIVFLYASPFNSSYTKSRETNVLEKFRTKDACCLNTLVMGDLNGRTKQGEDFVRDEEDKHCPADSPIYFRDSIFNRHNKDPTPIDQQGKLILEMCKSTGLRILNGRTFGDSIGNFTRYPLHKSNEKPSSIDYALCGHSLISDIYSFSVLPFTPLSDHCCLSTSVKINRITVDPPCDESLADYPEVTIHPNIDTFTFDPSRLEIFKENIRKDENWLTFRALVTFNDKPSPEEFLTGVSCISKILINSAKKSFLPKKIVPKSFKSKGNKKKVWYTKECASLKSILQKYCRKLSSRPFDKNLLNQFQTCKRNYKKTCKKAEKQYRLGMIEALKKVEKNEPKKFWNLIKKMNKWGNESKDDSDKILPKIWHRYYKSLLNSSERCPDRGNPEDYPPSYHPVLDGIITKKELKIALKDLKRNKIGPDGVLSDYLKVFGDIYEDDFLKTINGLFSENLYAEEWETNFLKPLHKKGDILDPDTYRGIAIGSAFAKLYSLILLNRLIKYIEENELISPHQIGFMKDCRTADHNFLLRTLVEKSKMNKKKLYVAFIDFKKAYDTVDRHLLFERLRKIGINGQFYRNIVSMYKNTNYSIKLKDGCIEPIHSNLGLRQGCPLSPMLFNLFIEDIGDIFTNAIDDDPVNLQGKLISHFLYADDLVLVSESACGLQNCLDKLGTYAERKSLTISIKKSKTMIFNAGGRFLKKQFHVNGEALEPVNSFCYLGFEIKPSGSMTHGASILFDKANKALKPLQRAIANFQLPLGLSIRLFHTLIEPIAMYNVENWSTLTDKQLENFSPDTIFDLINKSPMDTLHRKLLKYILGVNQSSPNLAVYGDSGEIPLSIKGFSLMLNFWHHLNNRPENSLAKLALKESTELRTNWIKTIEKIFNLFEMTGYVDNPCFKHFCKEKGKKIYVSKWEESISTTESSRLKFYKRIKSEHSVALYTALPFYQRKVIAKVRCSSHNLEIEKGRHKDVNAENRFCLMCSENSVEDEMHFLSFCKAYEFLRSKHGFADKDPVDIMNNSNQNNVAIYITKLFALRKKTLSPA